MKRAVFLVLFGAGALFGFGSAVHDLVHHAEEHHSGHRQRGACQIDGTSDKGCEGTRSTGL